MAVAAIGAVEPEADLQAVDGSRHDGKCQVAVSAVTRVEIHGLVTAIVARTRGNVGIAGIVVGVTIPARERRAGRARGPRFKVLGEGKSAGRTLSAHRDDGAHIGVATVIGDTELIFGIGSKVDEAVAVLQAHQAKEAAQKAVNSATGVPTV